MRWHVLLTGVVVTATGGDGICEWHVLVPLERVGMWHVLLPLERVGIWHVLVPQDEGQGQWYGGYCKAEGVRM